MSYNTGATFYPGGDDSYFMPEIIQPAPHRVNDHPTNMPQNVAHMEQQAQGRDPRYSPHINGSPQPNPHGWSHPPPPNHLSSYQQQPPSPYNQAPPQSSYDQPRLSPQPPTQTYNQQQYSTGLAEQPNFSPFPIIRNPPPNIPPTDEQKEATLEAAREPVLKCNDSETQLTWAQDVLSYVEIAQQNEQRVSATQSPRPRTPRIEHALREDAMRIVNFLADQHHPKAEFLRGMWLEFGKFGERIDKKEAFHCYTRAADKGYARSHYRIGMQFESSNDALKAIKYYQKGVDAGDSASCYRLGMMTLLGQHGQMQDFERGLNLIYSSAETADENAPQGAYVFGMLKAGELPQIKVPEQYLPQDAGAAKVNIEKAAYLGFSKAQVRMGAAYELGELGCPFDPALSLHYSALAARQGESEAEMAISKWFLCGHEGLFEKNEELAFTYAQRAAVNGLATAQFAMGYFYEVGIYVSADMKSAREWYQKAKSNGNPDAETRITAISRSKTISRAQHESSSLQRIRNQRGSASQNAPPMPSIPDIQSPSLDMPDPSRLNINSPVNQRPPSAAPYPSGQSSVPEFRPSSAFGVNPNLRTNSQPPAPGYGPAPYEPGPKMPPHPRPYDNRPYDNPPYDNPPYDNPPYDSKPYDSRPYDNGPSGYGRGGRLPPPGQIYPSQRPLQGRPGPPERTGTGSPNIQTQPARQGTPADIGFSAPIDATGADRKDRPQDYSGQRPYPPGQVGLPPRISSRPNPQNNNKPLPPSGPPNNQPRPPQQKQQYPPQNVKPANITPSRVSATPSPAPQKPAKPTKVSASAVNAPPKHHPGQGPASFEQMGIPKVKDKSDCVVM